MNFKPYLDLLSALLTPVIAVIATYIAYQQYRNNRAKLRHDLFERRMVVYDKAGDLIVRGSDSTPLTVDDFTNYAQSFNEANFLFGKDVCDYLTELDEKLCQRRSVELHLRTTPEEERAANQELKEIKEWFESQLEILNQRFMKYLNLKSLK